LQKKNKIHVPKVSTPTINRKSPRCTLYGGSHFKSFYGKKFTNHYLGDWVVVESKEFSVHRRSRKIHHATVTKRIALNLNGDKIEAKRANKFILNHNVKVYLKVGQKYRLPNGAVVKRLTKNKVKFFTTSGSANAQFVHHRRVRYINLSVRVPKEVKSIGACSGSMSAAHGVFKHELIIKASHHKKHLKISKRCNKRAKKRCSKHKGKKLRYCIFDICSNLGFLPPKSSHKRKHHKK